MKSFFTFAFLVLSIICYSQSTAIQGKIFDEDNKKPIPFANVFVLRSDSSVVTGTISDSLGYFHLSLQNSQQLTNLYLYVKHIEYKNYCTLYSNLKDPLRIELEQKSVSLEEVVITGNYQVAKNSLFGREYIIGDQIKEHAALATHVLENLPGIFVDFNDNIFVNGKGNVLILRNGIELPAGNFINQIQPASIAKVELTTNIPSKYSSKNYTAILNIITKEISYKNWSVNGKASPGNDVYDFASNFDIVKDKHSLYFYYKYYYRNFLEKSVSTSRKHDSTNIIVSPLETYPRKEIDNEFFCGYSYAFNNNLRIGLDLYSSFYREQYNTYFDNIVKTDYLDLTEDFDTYHAKAYLSYSDSLTVLSGNLRIDHKRLDDNILYHDPIELETYQEEVVTRIDGDLDITRKFGMGWQALTGASYSSSLSNNEVSYSSSQKFEEITFSQYSSIGKEYDNRGFTFGYNLFLYNKTFKNTGDKINSLYFFPKVTYFEKLSKASSLTFDISTNVSKPTFWQLLPMEVQFAPGLFLKGNPLLEPELHNRISLEYSYSKEQTLLSVKPFYSWTRNSIQTMYSDEINIQQDIAYINLDKISSYGFESSVNFKITPWWKVRFYSTVYNNKIPSNRYYSQTNKWSCDISALSIHPLSKKLLFAYRYQYYSSYLIYEGTANPYDSSLSQLRYTVNDRLNLSLIWIQPLRKYTTSSLTHNSTGMVGRMRTIDVQSILLSVRFFLIRSSKNVNPDLYENSDKKY